MLVQNAFSARLGPLGLEHYPMFVVDFLHEIEKPFSRILYSYYMPTIQTTFMN